MPLFEYVCRCREEPFELLIRGGESPACPACGSRDLEKQFSVPAAHVRSSGGLPVCEPPGRGGCGLPQCGTGGCQFDG